MVADGAEGSFADRVRAFAAEQVAPAAARWSMGQSPSPGIVREAAALGLLAVDVPAEHGGLGLGFPEKAEACRLLAAADCGFALSLVNTQNIAKRLCQSAGAEIIARHVPGLLSGETSACTAITEPGAGSDVAALATTARREGEDWVLTGEKTWIINARHAGLAIVYAQTRTPGDANGIGAFLVDLTAKGVTRYPIDSGFSQTSTGTGGFVMEEVRVPASHLLLPPGTAFKAVLGEITVARTYVAAMCNGMLRAAIDEAAAYGATRLSFGKPLAEHPAWRQPLGAAETELAASEALTAVATAQIAAGEDAQLAACQAKIQGAETCQRHLPALLHAVGAEGLRPERCFTRHLAAAQVAGLADGATTILRDRVARLTRHRAEKPKD